jgi:hypothetical protein
VSWPYTVQVKRAAPQENVCTCRVGPYAVKVKRAAPQENVCICRVGPYAIKVKRAAVGERKLPVVGSYYSKSQVYYLAGE